MNFLSIFSPLGELFLAESPAGLARIAWETSEEIFAGELEEECGRPPRRISPSDSPLLREAGQQLAAYFVGARQRFDLPLDLSRQTPFQRRVLTALLEVPYGEVVSYGELATMAGYHGAARAVGGAMRGNPLPVVIPCHRVILGSGELGGFGGRPHLKRRLLAIEGWGKER